MPQTQEPAPQTHGVSVTLPAHLDPYQPAEGLSTPTNRQIEAASDEVPLAIKDAIVLGQERPAPPLRLRDGREGGGDFWPPDQWDSLVVRAATRAVETVQDAPFLCA